MKAIVTGANGFLGSTLIEKLLKNGFEIYAIDISFKNRKIPLSEQIIEIECSIENIDEFKNLFPVNQIDLFYHLAWKGVNGLEKSNPNIQIKNIDLTLLCAKFAKEIGIKKFLCAGTIAERSIDSLNVLSRTSGGMMYASAKYATRIILETYCKNVGLEFVWMQFSNIFGPNNRTGNLVSYTLCELLNNREAKFGPANQPYDFVYVDDLIEAVYRLGINYTSKNIYYIGSGKPRLLKDYLIYIGTILSKENLIKIGEREDDGIKYSFEMFDIKDLIIDIGNYISKSFEESIKYTIENY